MKGWRPVFYNQPANPIWLGWIWWKLLSHILITLLYKCDFQRKHTMYIGSLITFVQNYFFKNAFFSQNNISFLRKGQNCFRTFCLRANFPPFYEEIKIWYFSEEILPPVSCCWLWKDIVYPYNFYREYCLHI